MKYIIISVGLLVIIFFVSCGPKAGYGPEDIVVLKGEILKADSTALARKEIGLWVFSLGSFLTNFFTLSPETKVFTDEDGKYKFEVKGETFLVGENTWYIAIGNTEDSPNPRAACGFYPTEIEEDVPRLKLWDGNPGVTVGLDTAVFVWTKLSRTHGSEPDRYYFTAEASGSGFALWQQDAVKDTFLRLPPYIFQNACQGWRIEARCPSSTYGQTGDTSHSYQYWSKTNQTAIQDTSPKLLSRNKNLRGEGSSTVHTLATDGNWSILSITTFNPKATYCWIDLTDSTRTITAFAAYDLKTEATGTVSPHGFDIFVSNDTTNWGTALKSTDKDEGYFYIDGFSKVGRYLKLAVKDPAHLKITQIREVGVFGL
ncbi:MAG: hypothetical protein ABIL05_03350 [candidate division WOR-3 bacterium]